MPLKNPPGIRFRFFPGFLQKFLYGTCIKKINRLHCGTVCIPWRNLTLYNVSCTLHALVDKDKYSRDKFHRPERDSNFHPILWTSESLEIQTARLWGFYGFPLKLLQEILNSNRTKNSQRIHLQNFTNSLFRVYSKNPCTNSSAASTRISSEIPPGFPSRLPLGISQQIFFRNVFRNFNGNICTEISRQNFLESFRRFIQMDLHLQLFLHECLFSLRSLSLRSLSLFLATASIKLNYCGLNGEIARPWVTRSDFTTTAVLVLRRTYIRQNWKGLIGRTCCKNIRWIG